METLPFEILHDLITNQLTLSEFVRLCSTNKSHLELCRNEELWKTLSNKEFPGVSKIEYYTWKRHYMTQKMYYQKNLKEFGPTYKPFGMSEVSHDFDLLYLKHLGKSSEDLNRKNTNSKHSHLPNALVNLANLGPRNLFNFFIVNPNFILEGTKSILRDSEFFWEYVLDTNYPGLEPKSGQTWKELFEETYGFSKWKRAFEKYVPVDLVLYDGTNVKREPIIINGDDTIASIISKATEGIDFSGIPAGEEPIFLIFKDANNQIIVPIYLSVHMKENKTSVRSILSKIDSIEIAAGNRLEITLFELDRLFEKVFNVKI